MIIDRSKDRVKIQEESKSASPLEASHETHNGEGGLYHIEFHQHQIIPLLMEQVQKDHFYCTQELKTIT